MTIEKSNSHSFDWQLACVVGVEKAILLGYFQFWIAINEDNQSTLHFREGCYWTYVTGDELVLNYPYLKSSSIYRWLGELEQSGWIKRKKFRLDGNRDQSVWYARGERLIDFNKNPIPQNEESPKTQELPIPQNENPIPQNETSYSQNDNSDSQNEKCNIKDTVINTVINTVIQQPASIDAVGGGEESLNPDDQKKGEQTPPQPLPTTDEVRQELLRSTSHRRYALDQLKLIKTDTEYDELIEVFITQQEMQTEAGKPVFQKLWRTRQHFMNWLGERHTRLSKTNTYHGNPKNPVANVSPSGFGQGAKLGTGYRQQTIQRPNRSGNGGS